MIEVVVCALVAVLVGALGAGGMWLGIDRDNTSAKVGGAVIVVIGVLGLISCLLLH
jgi:hypothetical protein